MKYACIQQYFDNGKVRVFVQESNGDEKDKYENRDDYDFYVDIFETKSQADDWARQARKS